MNEKTSKTVMLIQGRTREEDSYRILEKEHWNKIAQLNTKLVNVLKDQKICNLWVFLLERNLSVNVITSEVMPLIACANWSKLKPSR